MIKSFEVGGSSPDIFSKIILKRNCKKSFLSRFKRNLNLIKMNTKCSKNDNKVLIYYLHKYPASCVIK